jgi:hypothetical protein
MDTGVLSPQIKGLGHEADHSPPSSAEVKNDGAIPPFRHASSLRSAYLIKHIENFTFIGIYNLCSSFMHRN